MPLTPTGPDRHTPDDDEHEFAAFVQAQDPLDIEAATWVVRRRNGLDANGLAHLQDWLDADPRHAQALGDMDVTFGGVKQVPAGDVSLLKAGLPRSCETGPGAQSQQARPRRAAGRRAWPLVWLPWQPQAATAALVLVMACASWLGWRHWQAAPVFEQSFATQPGQLLSVSLPDDADSGSARGSTLFIDTASRLQARLFRDHREVHLMEGQAMFSVKSDAKRPFHVRAGQLDITVVGTRFSVRHTMTGLGARQTVVAVQEGRVRVARFDAPSAHAADPALDPRLQPDGVVLTAGQMVVADDAGRLGPVAHVPASAIATWRDGRIDFDQTPLSQAIAEFDRYGRTGLVVNDPVVAAMRVGGSHSLKHWRHFAETLSDVLPVRLIPRGENTEVVAR